MLVNILTIYAWSTFTVFKFDYLDFRLIHDHIWYYYDRQSIPSEIIYMARWKFSLYYDIHSLGGSLRPSLVISPLILCWVHCEFSLSSNPVLLILCFLILTGHASFLFLSTHYLSASKICTPRIMSTFYLLFISYYFTFVWLFTILATLAFPNLSLAQALLSFWNTSPAVEH